MKHRLIVTLAVLGGLTVVLVGVGFLVGMSLVELKMQVIGMSTVVMSKPSEPAGVSIATALLFGWFGVSALVAVAVHRWRRGDAPSVRAVIAYFAIPVVVAAGHFLLNLEWLSNMNWGGAKPMMSLASLGPGTDEARIVGFVSLCVWIFVGTWKPKVEKKF